MNVLRLLSPVLSSGVHSLAAEAAASSSSPSSSLSVFEHSVLVAYTRALLMSAGGRELAKRSYKKFFHCTRVNPCVYVYFSRVCSMVKTIYTRSRKHLNGLL